ncbi:MAG: FAD-dependent oxidoreductase [Lentisphaerae bacterium]|nr:FAD-dependent oxidoreductase [Lentisphaerota bacterium]
MSTASRYRVAIPGPEHWKEEIKCQDACPVHTDARGYVRAIASGDVEKAYLIARGPNPLASICGRICGAPCEVNCRRGSLDKPIAIRALKRYAVERHEEQYLAQANRLIAGLDGAFKALACAGVDEQAGLKACFTIGRFERARGQRVAIIGSGPAGLAAAHDLALFGFAPVIFESEGVPGGMLYLGVPGYRLPRKVIKAEIDSILSLGIEARVGVTVGKDVLLAQLLDEFAAVIIAVGAKKSRRLAIKGSQGQGVVGGVDLLRAVALKLPIAIGEQVIVIGGGNVAYDVSRTAIRLSHTVDTDVSRVALRQARVKEVHLCCLESREAMLADEVEIQEGAAEGVMLHNAIGPDEILLDESGRVRGVRFKKVLSIFDAQGRFAPTFDERDTCEIRADTVLVSIGQAVDLSFVDAARDGVQLTPAGALALDEDQSTTRPGLFAVGDAQHGPKLMIHAIASGKKAARSVYKYLMGKELALAQTSGFLSLENYRRETGYESIPRRAPPSTVIAKRLQAQDVPVEACFNPAQAISEASRCLDCGVNTIFDGSKCILCGGCADVCPESCLRLVAFDRLDGDSALTALRHRRPDAFSLDTSAIIKNDERCIRCGVCAERCPVGAITMERFTFKNTCGTASRSGSASN